MLEKIIKNNDPESNRLIKEALAGSVTALEKLIETHYTFIYNIAFRFTFDHFDAEDLTQEVIIKVITNLSQFEGKSQFSTWLYRIVFNHFLNTNRKKNEYAIMSFSSYGKGLDDIPDTELSELERIELKELIEDAKIGCMTGMLLCLKRKHRLVYILGEIFKIDSKTAASFMDILSDNFRKILSRAKKLLNNFIINKCGLIISENSCLCQNKVKGFIRVGWVNDNKLEFNNHYINKISDIILETANQFSNSIQEKYYTLFSDHPFYNKNKTKELLKKLINDKDLQILI